MPVFIERLQTSVIISFITVTTEIFGDLSGYFFGNVGVKTSNITWRYAAPCWPVIDCKMNDLEWLFQVKIRLRPARLSRAYLCVSSAFLLLLYYSESFAEYC